MAVLNKILANYSTKVSPVNCLLCCSAPTAKHAFAIPCLHEYCYNCIFDCMEVKPNCPICTKSVTEIMYEVRDANDYKTLSVDTIPTRANVHFVLKQMLSTLPKIYNLFLHQSDEISSFARQHRGEVIPNRTDSLAWRLFIYENGVFSLPIPDENDGLRECSPELFASNADAIGRIWPWLSRELISLEKYTNSHICAEFCKLVYEKITVYDLYSIEFYNLFADRNFPFTNHFIHELHNYAISACNMVDYDTRVICKPFFERHYNRPTFTDLNGRPIGKGGNNADNGDAVVRSNWDERVDYGRAVLDRIVRQSNNDVLSVGVRSSNITNINVNINVDNDNRNINVENIHVNSEEEDMTDDDSDTIPYPPELDCYCFPHRLYEYAGLDDRPPTPPTSPTYSFDNIKKLNTKRLTTFVESSPEVHTKKNLYSITVQDILPPISSSLPCIIFDSSNSDADAACNSTKKTHSGSRKKKLLSNRKRNERKK